MRADGKEVSPAQMNQSAALGSELGTQALATLLGITFRRLDWAVRRSNLRARVTQGNRRVWSVDTIRRLQAAVAITNAIPGSVIRGDGAKATELPRMVDIVMAGPPPVEGWAVLEAGRVAYHPRWGDVEVIEGGVVAAIYDLWPEEVTREERTP